MALGRTRCLLCLVLPPRIWARASLLGNPGQALRRDLVLATRRFQGEGSRGASGEPLGENVGGLSVETIAEIQRAAVAAAGGAYAALHGGPGRGGGGRLNVQPELDLDSVVSHRPVIQWPGHRGPRPRPTGGLRRVPPRLQVLRERQRDSPHGDDLHAWNDAAGKSLHAVRHPPQALPQEWTSARRCCDGFRRDRGSLLLDDQGNAVAEGRSGSSRTSTSSPWEPARTANSTSNG